ncbi:MAG: FHA domain-containing protein [Gammaproteobacteria bacterium]|jgi:hypothetical protein|nr:FHA domain-containing protein [Gammaproteobacteria bacterium]
MFKNLFTKPIELKIGDQVLQFNSDSDFAFIMEGRTAVSSEKLSELFKLPIDQLEKQTKMITKTKDSLFLILSDAAGDPDSIDRSIRELDSMVFSQDHSWRDIIKALNEGNEELNSLRMTVLSKYIKYLSSLESTIDNIYQEKKQAVGTPDSDDEKATPDFGATWASASLEDEFPLDIPTTNEFKRLPKDKEVTIQFPPGKQLDIRMETFKCKLLATDDNVQFIDNSGVTILEKGSHIIGRGKNSSVKIDAAQKYVSRTHLRVLVDNDHTIQLTDLSTSGTFIPAEYLD